MIRSLVFLISLGLVFISCGGDDEPEPTTSKAKSTLGVVKPGAAEPAGEVAGKEEVEEVEEIGGEPRKEIVWQKDGSKMVLIPAGSFDMGDALNEGEKDEQPIHKVELEDFYMDVHEITVQQWRKFKGGKAMPAWAKNASPGNKHPVIGLKWEDAALYAKAMGKRVPT